GGDSATAPGVTTALAAGTKASIRFTKTTQWRALAFDALAGQSISVYVDGKSELDTVAYLYRRSRITGRPYYKPLQTNDDTAEGGWTQNRYGSSFTVTLPETRPYAIVVTTYEHSSTG